MKINSINNVNKIMSIYSKNQHINKVDNVKMKKDEIEISQNAKDFQIALDAFKNLPDIREDKVNDIKNKIDSGNYKVNINQIAMSMMGKNTMK